MRSYLLLPGHYPPSTDSRSNTNRPSKTRLRSRSCGATLTARELIESSEMYRNFSLASNQLLPRPILSVNNFVPRVAPKLEIPLIKVDELLEKTGGGIKGLKIQSSNRRIRIWDTRDEIIRESFIQRFAIIRFPRDIFYLLPFRSSSSFFHSIARKLPDHSRNTHAQTSRAARILFPSRPRSSPTRDNKQPAPPPPPSLSTLLIVQIRVFSRVSIGQTPLLLTQRA